MEIPASTVRVCRSCGGKLVENGGSSPENPNVCRSCTTLNAAKMDGCFGDSGRVLVRISYCGYERVVGRFGLVDV